MNQEKTINDILEVVHFIKDNAAMKMDLESLATNDALLSLEINLKEHIETRFTEVKTELITHIDSFVVLHQKLDTELTALRSKYERLERHIGQLAKHLQLSLQ